MEDSNTKNFVQYFLITGLDVNFGLEADDANLSIDLYCGDAHSPLERSYKPRILRHFPDMTAWSHFNPEALSRLCLPRGIRFSNDHTKHPPTFHPFVLTKEDGTKSCGFSLVFMEEVKDMNICHALHTLQKMHSTETESGTIKKNERVRPSSCSRPQASSRSRSLPRHYTTRLSGSNLDLSTSTYDYRKDTLYASKSIAIICSLPFVNTANQVLHTLHKYVGRSDYELCVLESFIYNLLHDIPLPSPGRTVKFWCLGEQAAISLPKMPNELETFDYPLIEFFDVLGVSNIVKLLTCVLLEHQVLVFSSDCEKLMLVCESILTLIYPFQWPHVYVPILPPTLENFLDAPVPYIMGLLRRTNEMNIYSRAAVCIVDIDNGELEMPEELPYFPYENELEDEIRSVIMRFGGKEGAALLRSQVTEELEELNQNSRQGRPPRRNDNSRNEVHDIDQTVERLNEMIEQIESLTGNNKQSSTNKTSGDGKLDDKIVLNVALREVFANRFVNMLHSFEQFVIINDEEDLNSTVGSSGGNDQPFNFDKISFLSEQIQSHLAFLSSFLETQMFSSFIDYHIQSISGGMLPESPFYQRLSRLKARYGETLVRTPAYEPCDNFDSVIHLLKYRLSKVELTVSPQKPNRGDASRQQLQDNSQRQQQLQDNNQRQQQRPGAAQASPAAQQAGDQHNAGTGQSMVMSAGIFPLLDPGVFEKRHPSTDNATGSSTAVYIRGDRRSRVLDLNHMPSQKISLLSPSQASIAETNWKFVNQLLKETKQKTKRILLEKLGLEAVEWGHGQPGFSGTEENMLVGSLCDLLERIWAHGLQSRQKKSSFWSFLVKFIRHHERMAQIPGALGSQAFCVPLISSKPYLLPDHSRPVQVAVLPLNTAGSGSGLLDMNILAVMHNVTTIHEIRTEIGYSRAWIRLALEQKVLANHLATILKDLPLLRSTYKRYAFLRCEEEREQALYYLHTLNAVDFSCFTNAYFNSYVLYQVLIFPSQKSGNSSLTSANVWLHVVGSHTETDYLHVPRGVIHFSFWAKNLGLLTSLRIGHDNSGLTPNWLVEHVLIKNEFTGVCYKFPCGRWLGKSIDDGSLERYLVATSINPGIPGLQEMRQIVRDCAGPPTVSSPALSLRSTGPQPDDIEIQTMLGEAINRLIKHHHKSLKERVSWAQLMCGETGLVHALIMVFSFGFKSARLFGKNLAVWDFFLKVTFDFNQSQSQSLGGGSNTSTPQGSPVKKPSGAAVSGMSLAAAAAGDGQPRPGSSTVPRTTQLRRMYTRLITRIETTCSRLGKDDKFQLFVCLAVHDRLLQRIVADLTRAVAAIQLYDEFSFLRDPTLAGYLTHVLDALTTVEVPVDPAMKKSLEQQ